MSSEIIRRNEKTFHFQFLFFNSRIVIDNVNKIIQETTTYTNHQINFR